MINPDEVHRSPQAINEFLVFFGGQGLAICSILWALFASLFFNLVYFKSGSGWKRDASNVWIIKFYGLFSLFKVYVYIQVWLLFKMSYVLITLRIDLIIIQSFIYVSDFSFSNCLILKTEMNINLHVLRRDSMDAFQKCMWFSVTGIEEWHKASGDVHAQELVCILCYFLVCHLYPCGWKHRLVVPEART